MRRLILALFIGALWVCPAPAPAQTWQRDCLSGDLRTTTSFEDPQDPDAPLAPLCFDPTAITDDSPILDVRPCNYTNWVYAEDKDGSGTSSTVEYTLKVCASPDITDFDNGCDQVEGTDVLGSTATDLHEAGIGAGPWLMVQSNDAGTSPAQGRIIVTCSGGVGGLR